ncbi:hypothetical protein [Streptomyces sp. NPDC054961]
MVLEEAVRRGRDGFTRQELDVLRAFRTVRGAVDVAHAVDRLSGGTAPWAPRSALLDCRRTRPWAIAAAEHQLRADARNPPGRLLPCLGGFSPVPGAGLPDPEIQDWLPRRAVPAPVSRADRRAAAPLRLPRSRPRG